MVTLRSPHALRKDSESNSKDGIPTSGIVKVGLWGESHPPTPKDIDGNPERLTAISIRYSGHIESIRFRYVADGTAKQTTIWGTSSGNADEIKIEDGDYLNEISGHYGKDDGNMAIRSLKFATNKGYKYGPYGREEGTHFSLPVKNGQVVAFFGGVHQSLSAIGCYLKPNNN